MLLSTIRISSTRYLLISFFLMIPPPPSSTLFPYTTLFRSAPGNPAHVLVSDREAEHIPGCNMECAPLPEDRKSTRLNSSHQIISYAVFCLKKKTMNRNARDFPHARRQK